MERTDITKTERGRSRTLVKKVEPIVNAGERANVVGRYRREGQKSRRYRYSRSRRRLDIHLISGTASHGREKLKFLEEKSARIFSEAGRRVFLPSRLSFRWLDVRQSSSAECTIFKTFARRPFRNEGLLTFDDDILFSGARGPRVHALHAPRRIYVLVFH